jgi:DNA-directed RNA polymerase subunit RPC12/RpoP
VEKALRLLYRNILMGYLIFAAAPIIAYWTVRELLLYTFKDASRKRPFIIGFALVGLVIAVVFLVSIKLWVPHGPIPTWLGILILVLCPPSMLQIIFIDIPHPPVSWLAVVWILTALMNSALYAAIGGRVGAHRFQPPENVTDKTVAARGGVRIEKVYTCRGCSKNFKVVDDPTEAPSAQHEIECNVECPYCGRTNAIVWPQHGFHLVEPMD